MSQMKHVYFVSTARYSEPFLWDKNSSMFHVGSNTERGRLKL